MPTKVPLVLMYFPLYLSLVLGGGGGVRELGGKHGKGVDSRGDLEAVGEGVRGRDGGSGESQGRGEKDGECRLHCEGLGIVVLGRWLGNGSC